eukprot:gene4456-3251_t
MKAKLDPNTRISAPFAKVPQNKWSCFSFGALHSEVSGHIILVAFSIALQLRLPDITMAYIPASFTDGDGSVGPGDSSKNLASGVSDHTLGSIFSSSMPVHMKALAVGQHMKHSVTGLFSQLRPWSEFFDRVYFAAPEGFSDAISRFMANARYFYPNYLLLSLLCSSYVLVINFTFSICLLIALLFYYYVQTEAAALAARGNYLGRISIAGQSLSTFQLYVMIGVFGLVGFYFTNGSSVVFWLLVTTLGVVAPHAMCRRPALVDPAFQFA